MRGILFKPDMIKAICNSNTPIHYKPRYQVGETVYIKEAWCESYYGEPICYKLDGKESPGPKGFWRSPMSLKAVNARYFIKIVDIRADGIGYTLLRRSND